MTLLEFIVLVLIAALCGGVGRSIAGNTRGGLLVSIALGFIGAILGTWVARELALPELFVLRIDEVAFPIVWSIIGSALFVAVLSLFTRSARAA